MANVGERLVENVRRFQMETGEDSMMVVVEKADKQIAICNVSFDPYYGLLVDGRPPSVQWHQDAEDFHLLQLDQRVLH